jgi:PIN domain nuclease of toxin-antitoxin system
VQGIRDPAQAVQAPEAELAREQPQVAEILTRLGSVQGRRHQVQERAIALQRAPDLAIDAEHAIAVQGLPAHHQDPVDRMLVAQALVEPMRLMTDDPTVAVYSDTIIKI